MIKKLLLLSAFLIFACSSDDNNQNNSSIIGYWNFYSSLGVTLCGSTVNDTVYYDSDCYCDELFIEFKSNGSFREYYDFISVGNPGCSDEILTGTWTNSGSEYQLNYNAGYTDIYNINLIDDNTMSFEFDGTIYTYKKTL